MKVYTGMKQVESLIMEMDFYRIQLEYSFN